MGAWDYIPYNKSCLLEVRWPTQMASTKQVNRVHVQYVYTEYIRHVCPELIEPRRTDEPCVTSYSAHFITWLFLISTASSPISPAAGGAAVRLLPKYTTPRAGHHNFRYGVHVFGPPP